MPRYFFHLRDRAGTLLNIEGSEHRDPQAAAAEAMGRARSIIVEQVRHRGALAMSDRVEVTDAAGTIVATVTFAGSLHPSGQITCELTNDRMNQPTKD